METSLHRQLKLLYAPPERTEVTVADYRIDAIADCGELIEIQHASLGALRDKTNQLLRQRKRRLRIVKPLLARKRIVTLDQPDGEVLRSRMSPKRGELLDLFEDLVHFATVFPKKRLTLEIPLIVAEEIRVDLQESEQRRRRWRRKKYRCLDQKLVEVSEVVQLQVIDDLLKLLPIESLPQPFDTAELAAAMKRPRWFAQKVAYCLRKMGATKLSGKRGKSQLYRLAKRRRPRAA